jgi:hypothetical protein
MKHLFAIITTILLLTACQKDEEVAPYNPVKNVKHTVLVYMPSENNLSPYAQNDINEMIQGRKSVGDDCDLLIFVDKASQTEMPFIARISADSKTPVDTLYQYPADFYTSEPSKFQEVLQRMISFSPTSQDYGLVLWGHANGWILENDGRDFIRRAYGVDNGNNEATAQIKEPARWLNIPDMAKSFKQVGKHWRFLFFDCCNMQNAEVAYELRSTTDYIIASPAEITGEGAPYDNLVPDFFIEDTEQMAIKTCADYYAQLDYVQGHLPISVVKTSQMQALADATKNILPEIAAWLKTSNPTQGIIYYYNYDSAYKPDREKMMYDMNDMIRAALADAPEKFDAWKTTFRQAVIYAEMSKRWHANSVNFNDFTVTEEKYGGMSMFFPLQKYTNASHDYNNDIKKLEWYQAVGWSTQQ